MSPYRKVVVPCDGEPDDATIAVARGVAARLRVPVVLFSIVGAGLEANDEAELHQLAARIGPDVEADVVADDGRPTSAQLAEVAGEPGSLMCLRTHAQPAVLEAIFGSISEAVIRTGKSSVLVVGPRCTPDFAGNRMIIAVEREPIDDSGLRTTLDLANALGLTPEYITTTALPDNGTSAAEHEPPPEQTNHGLIPANNHLLHRTVIAGSHTRVLTTLSQSADVAMIAMTTHSRGALARLIVGSTTLKLIRQAECPVLAHSLRT